MGDVELITGAAPIEIGNRVWDDTDKDGTQDAGETGISGVSVSLCTGAGALIATAVTDGTGNYYFSSGSGTATTSALYSLTALKATTSYQLKFPITASGKSLATANAGADNIDSDASSGGVVSFSTGSSGANDHTFDVGYSTSSCALTATATPGTCNSVTNQYTVSGSISLTGNTAGGTATITDGAKSTTVTVGAAATSVAYSLTGLTSGTGSHTVVVNLPGCGSAVVVYAAPASCTVAPTALAVVVGVPVCNTATNNYTATGTVSLTNATAGSLTITDNGTTVVVVSVTAGQPSATFSVSGVSGSSPATHTVVATLSTATGSTTYATPASCASLSVTSATVCAGGTVSLTATGCSTAVTWSSGGTPSGNILTVTTSTTSASQQVLSFTASCGPSGLSATGTVTVNPAVTATIAGNLSICAGQSTTLTASGGSTYIWNTGGVTASISVSTAGTYSVTATSSAGCSNTATVTVTVNPLPVVALSSATICQGVSTTLTASGGMLYNFGSGNSATGTLVVNPTTTTTYSVIVTNASGCTASATGTVTVNLLPTASLSSATICQGQTVTLTASGGSGQPGTLYDFGNGNQASNTLVINPATTTAYSVLVTNASGCTAIANGMVTVNLPPTASLSSATICQGQTVTLTASGGTLYNFGSGNSATGTLIVNPAANTTYNVVVTNASGCTAMATGTVTVNLLPVATLSSATICQGNSATLTAGGGTSYTLLNTNAINITGQFVLSPSITTAYTVVAMNAQGCTAPANSLIVVNLLPIATLSSATICEGNSATLTASGGGTGGPFTYEFSGSINNATGILVVNPATTTTYSVVVTNASGCTAMATGTVTVNAVPVVVIVPTNPVVCLGSSATLTVTNCTGALRWNTGETTGSIIITPIINTTYTVTCTTPQGCTTSTYSEVVVSQPGSVSVADNAPLCAGATLQLATGGSGTSYSWRGPNGFTANTATVSVSNVSAINAGVYSVTVTGGVCSGTGSTTVTLSPAVTASMSSASICDGASVTLVASGGGAGSGPFSYEFTGNVTNNTGRLVVSPSASTIYSVTVTNGQGCVGVASGTVTVNPAVTATYSSATICAGQSATLLASGGTLYNFGSGNTTGNLIIVSPASTTAYNVVVSNGFGCTALATATVVVNPLPIPTLSSATICQGGSVTLTASGGNVGAPFSYSFSTGSTNSTGALSVTPSGTTTYSVLVSSSAGCVAPASGTVTVNLLPVATLTSATICRGGSATLTASGGAGLAGTFYDFGNGSSAINTLVVSPTATTFYSVIVTNVAGCQATATADVMVNPVPQATLTSATICGGNSVTLTASGGLTGSYSYTLLETGAVNATGSFPLSPTATTTYNVLIANSFGCTAQAAGSIMVNPLPTATLSGATICQGASTTLTASGGVLYNFGSGNTTDPFLIVNPASTTTYSVVVSSSSGCTTLTRGTVVINPLPVVNFASATICAGTSATLVASVTGNQSGLLFNFGSGNSTGGSLIVNPASTTAYSVVVTNANGCTALANAMVTVNPQPTVGITSVSCVGLSTFSITFTATAGASVSASVGTLTGNQVTGIPSGQAVVLTANLLGCTATVQTSQNCNLNAASLGDFVFEDVNRNGIQDSGDVPISGAIVTLLQNGSAVATTTSSLSGLYSFMNLTPGIPYSVSFTTPAGFSVSTWANVGDDALDSDALNGLTGPYTLTAGENNPTVDAGFVRPVLIEVVTTTPICNTATNQYTTTATVSLTNAPAGTLTLTDNGQTVGTVSVTAGQTSASFTLSGVSGSSPASHSVVATLANGLTVVASTTYATPASCTVCSLSLTTSLLANGQIGTAYSETLTVSGGTAPINYTISAGSLPTGLVLNASTGVISGTPTAPAGTASFTVKVTDAKNCSAIAPLTITTSAEPVCSLITTATPTICNSVNNTYTVTGTVSATNAPATQSLTIAVNGSSTIVILTSNGPVSYTLSGLTSDGLVKTVSVVSSASACGMASVTYTAPVSCTVAPLKASLGDYVWLDTNKNGVQDGTESGVQNVTVVLCDAVSGSAISSTLTDSNGLYLFPNLNPGSYVVKFTAPAGTTFTIPNSSSATPGTDSNVASVTGQKGSTAPVSLTAGENNLTIDGGLIPVLAPPALAVAVGTPICNTATNNYTTTATVSLTNATAGTLTITENGTVVGTVSVTAGQTTASFTLTGVSGSQPQARPVVASLSVATSSSPYTASTVYAAPPSCTVCSLSLTTSMLANGQIGVAYSQTLTTANGTAPISYTISAGMLPAGLSLNPTTGVISGTPTAPAGTASFTVKVTDAKNCSAVAPLTITTAADPVCELKATATPGVCNSATNTYTVTGTVSATNAGTNSPQTLTVSVNGTRTVVTLTGNGPVSYTLSGLTSDGLVKTVSVVSSASACGMTSVTYAAPASCTVAPASFRVVKLVSEAKPQLGEIISYTVVVVNTGPVAATSIVVSDSFSAGLSLIPGSVSVSAGSFTPGLNGGQWAIASLPANATATLIYSASVIAEGVIYNTATVSPGNDQAQVCISVPFKVCKGMSFAIEVNAPAGFSRYQWYRTAPGSTSSTVVSDGTLNTFTATQPGEYNVVVDNGINGACSNGSCCPIVIEEVEVPLYTAMGKNPTCVGTTPQANGQITLTNLGVDPTAYFYQVSPGSSFTAGTAVPSSPTPVPADGVVGINLGAGTYTVRVWVLVDGQPSCPRDVTVVLVANCACPEEICVPITIRKSKRVTQ